MVHISSVFRMKVCPSPILGIDLAFTSTPAERIQQRLSCCTLELLYCTAPFVASTVWTHSLLAAPGQPLDAVRYGHKQGNSRPTGTAGRAFNGHQTGGRQAPMLRKWGMGEQRRPGRESEAGPEADGRLYLLGSLKRVANDLITKLFVWKATRFPVASSVQCYWPVVT